MPAKSISWSLTRLVALGTLVAASAAQAGSGRVALRPACTRAALNQPPGWSNSGYWNSGELVLVDTVNRALVRYSPTGRALGGTPALLGETLRATYPSRISSSGGQLVLQAAGNRFLSLDRDYALKGVMSARSRPDRHGATVEKVFDWALAGDDVVGFGEVKDTRDRWYLGIVRFPLNRPGEFQPLWTTTNVQDPTRAFHRLGYAYTAAIGNQGFVIRVDDAMRLFRSDPNGSFEEMVHPGKNGQSVDALGTVPTPELPNFDLPQNYAAAMRAVERSSMPTAIYGWGKDLFVISRRPQGGSTEWSLSRINVAESRIVETTIIPSRAHHLFAVPGDKQWAFVEKGAARGLDEQDVTGVLFVPAERIRNTFSADLCE